MLKTVLCYGDSNTFGLMPDLAHRYPREVRWTGRLQARLGADYYVVEEGLGGRTTVWDDPVEMHKNGRTYLLPCLESHRPLDLVVLMLGTNDLKDRFHVSAFTIGQSIDNLMTAIEQSAAGPDFCAPQILLVCPVPVRDVGNADLNQMLPGAPEKSRALGNYYRAAAQKHGAHYFEPGDRVEVSATDGIHYTPEGHARMAELMEEQIRAILP